MGTVRFGLLALLFAGCSAQGVMLFDANVDAPDPPDAVHFDAFAPNVPYCVVDEADLGAGCFCTPSRTPRGVCTPASAGGPCCAYGDWPTDRIASTCSCRPVICKAFEATGVGATCGCARGGYTGGTAVAVCSPPAGGGCCVGAEPGHDSQCYCSASATGCGAGFRSVPSCTADLVDCTGGRSVAQCSP